VPCFIKPEDWQPIFEFDGLFRLGALQQLAYHQQMRDVEHAIDIVTVRYEPIARMELIKR